MQPYCMKILDAEAWFAGIGCSIVACIQSVSSACNYCIEVTTNAKGTYAVKLDVSIGFRQIASNGCNKMFPLTVIYV